MEMSESLIFAASLGLFILSATLCMVSLGTRAWVTAGDALSLGLWDYCVSPGEEDQWTCYSNFTEFTMAAQAFCILAVVGYVSTFILYLISFIFPSLHKSRVLTIGICLLGFSIVSLQIMAVIVFGVKVTDYHHHIALVHFTDPIPDLSISWSVVSIIASTLLATVAGICVFLQLRNITMPEFTE